MASAGDARLLKSTKFPPEFSQKVDMQKVNLQVIKKFVTGAPTSLTMGSPDFQKVLTAQPHRWIANRISEILGNEDDVVIELCFNLIDGPRYVRFSRQISLLGLLTI